MLFEDSDPQFRDLGMDTLRLIVQDYFNILEQLDPIVIRQGSWPLRKFFIHICRGYDKPKRITTELLHNSLLI